MRFSWHLRAHTGAYAATLYVSTGSGEGRLLGLGTMAAVVTIDLLMYLSWFAGSMTSPIVLCWSSLLSRGFLISFGTRFWFVGHSAMFVLFGLVSSVVFVRHRMRRVQDQRLAQNALMMAAVAAQGDEGAGENEAASSAVTTNIVQERPCLDGILRNPLLSLILLILIFSGEIFVVYRGFPGLQLQPIILLDESVAHGQWELGLGAVFIVFIAGLFHWAIAAMRSAATRDSSRVPLAFDAEAKAVCVAFEVVVLGGGIGLHIVTGSYIVLYSSIFAPIVVFAVLLWHSKWRSNDYRCFSKRSRESTQ